MNLYCYEILTCGTIMLIQIDFHNLMVYIVISKVVIKLKYQGV